MAQPKPKPAAKRAATAPTSEPERLDGVLGDDADDILAGPAEGNLAAQAVQAAEARIAELEELVASWRTRAEELEGKLITAGQGMNELEQTLKSSADLRTELEAQLAQARADGPDPTALADAILDAGPIGVEVLERGRMYGVGAPAAALLGAASRAHVRARLDKADLVMVAVRSQHGRRVGEALERLLNPALEAEAPAPAA